MEEASAEFLDALAIYAKVDGALAERFKREVDSCLNKGVENPGIYRQQQGNYQRINLKVFPYYIAWVVRDETLWILAISHSKRRPHYWISRRDRI